jgi:hypothetical protein
LLKDYEVLLKALGQRLAMLALHLNAFGTAAVSIRTPANWRKKSIYNFGFRPDL